MKRWYLDIIPLIPPSVISEQPIDEVIDLNGRKLAFCGGIDSDKLNAWMQAGEEIDDLM